MKLKGEFLVRDVAGELLAIPVGQTALNFNGMICLNDVSALIWKGLQEGKTKDAILETILNEFDVSHEEAAEDLEQFLQELRSNDLLTIE
jgi:hypothetical protein